MRMAPEATALSTELRGQLIMNYKLLIMNDIELILIIHASNISNFPLSFEKNFTFQNAEGL